MPATCAQIHLVPRLPLLRRTMTSERPHVVPKLATSATGPVHLRAYACTTRDVRRFRSSKTASRCTNRVSPLLCQPFLDQPWFFTAPRKPRQQQPEQARIPNGTVSCLFRVPCTWDKIMVKPCHQTLVNRSKGLTWQAWKDSWNEERWSVPSWTPQQLITTPRTEQRVLGVQWHPA